MLQKSSRTSIEDQERNARTLAQREGWTVTAMFADKALSGSLKDRPQYQAMLKAAHARAFAVLIVDDLSRLSRDQVEQEQAFRRLESWGIRIVSASDGTIRAARVARSRACSQG
jgi:DNA invertase Pin-like site-specific DNA recombinase